MAHDHEHSHDHPGFEVQVERTGPCLASVRMRVPAAEFERSRRLGLSTVARRTRLKGFRPGKVPPALIEKQFGAEVDRDVIQHFVQHAFDKAVQENELRPAAQPRIDLESIATKPGQDLEHEFELLLRPEVELGEFEGLEIDAQPVEVSDEELEEALADVRRQLSHPEPAGDDGLPADGMAVCSLAFLRPGVDEPVLDRDGIRISPKTAPRGIEPEEFESALTGAKVDDVREFSIVFPEDFPDEEVRGETGSCRVTVTEAFKIVAPTDDELREKLDVVSDDGEEPEAALRRVLASRIESSKQEAEDRRVETALLDRLLETHPMELPEPLIQAQVDARVAEARQTLETQGLEAAEVEARLAEEGRRAHEATSRAMKAVYLMEEVARAKEIKVKDEDLQAELTSIARRNGVELDEVRKYYQEEGLFQQLALELLERKVRSFLRESADIKAP